MFELLKSVYRKIKYSVFISREQEYLKFHKGRQKKLIAEYITKHAILKLQIGAQSHAMADWLNVDIQPKTPEVAYMDATKYFPIENNSFNYVFSEHMIEHISFDEAQFMLKECYRILKPGGKIRIATPDLNKVIKVFNDSENPENKDYIKFYIDRFYNIKLPYDPVFMINKMFYDFGHRFIHTEFSLRFILQGAGFIKIEICAVGESNDDHFKNSEQHWGEIGMLNNSLETIVLQAEK